MPILHVPPHHPGVGEGSGHTPGAAGREAGQGPRFSAPAWLALPRRGRLRNGARVGSAGHRRTASAVRPRRAAGGPGRRRHRGQPRSPLVLPRRDANQQPGPGTRRSGAPAGRGTLGGGGVPGEPRCAAAEGAALRTPSPRETPARPPARSRRRRPPRGERGFGALPQAGVARDAHARARAPALLAPSPKSPRASPSLSPPGT